LRYWSLKFGFDVIEGKPIIHCICGRKFWFEGHPKAKCLGRCPFCNELWHCEKDKDGNWLLIHPRTNAGIHFEDDQDTKKLGSTGNDG